MKNRLGRDQEDRSQRVSKQGEWLLQRHRDLKELDSLGKEVVLVCSEQQRTDTSVT